MTILLWQSHLTNLNDLLSHIMDTAKYPTDMYENLGSIHFYIFDTICSCCHVASQNIIWASIIRRYHHTYDYKYMPLFFSRFFGVLLSALIPARVVDPSSVILSLRQAQGKLKSKDHICIHISRLSKEQ